MAITIGGGLAWSQGRDEQPQMTPSARSQSRRSSAATHDGAVTASAKKPALKMTRQVEAMEGRPSESNGRATRMRAIVQRLPEGRYDVRVSVPRLIGSLRRAFRYACASGGAFEDGGRATRHRNLVGGAREAALALPAVLSGAVAARSVRTTGETIVGDAAGAKAGALVFTADFEAGTVARFLTTEDVGACHGRRAALGDGPNGRLPCPASACPPVDRHAAPVAAGPTP